MDHAVHHGLVVHPVPPPRLVEEVRRVAHALHTADGEDVVLPRLDGVGGEHGGLECGATHGVDREGPYLHREAGTDGGLPRRVLPEAGGENVAHDALLHVRGPDTCPAHGFLDAAGAEFGRFYARERLAVLSDCGPACAYDNCFFHLCSLLCNVTDSVLRYISVSVFNNGN